jgi:hypothetical protein
VHFLGSTDWLAAGRGRLWRRYSHLRSDRGRVGCAGPLFQRNLIRLGPLDYSGLRGEGSIPVPSPSASLAEAAYSPGELVGS